MLCLVRLITRWKTLYVKYIFLGDHDLSINEREHWQTLKHHVGRHGLKYFILSDVNAKAKCS